MPLIEALLPEFDHEMSTTRTVLERVPGDKFEWRPHQKSYSIGQLASHLATIPTLGEIAITRPDLDASAAQMPQSPRSHAELLATFDRNAAAARAALAAATDAVLMSPWSLKRGGQTLFTQPKTTVWRGFVMSHLIHHRGQLCVYLRLLDVPVPSVYGPSADEAAP
jgi:uncharacterized damage-inducible protein DinB